MKRDEKTIKIKKRKVRDPLIENMITTPGGVHRVHREKKKFEKANASGRFDKHKKKEIE